MENEENFRYLTVFKEQRGYTLSSQSSFDEQLDFIRLGEKLGHTHVYQGKIEMARFLEGGFETFREFVDQANKTGKFDSEKLKRLLENHEPALSSQRS